jgi:hypothetical protein
LLRLQEIGDFLHGLVIVLLLRLARGGVGENRAALSGELLGIVDGHAHGAAGVGVNDGSMSHR